MRDNWNHIVKVGQVALVPYQRSFVPKYHDWLEDEWLRDMTATERLSLEEEYEAQAAWINDKEKCTFIVFEKDSITSDSDTTASEQESGSTNTNTNSNTSSDTSNNINVNLNGMVGDTNLFLMDDERGDEYDLQDIEFTSQGKIMNDNNIHLYKRHTAEIMVMIGENKSRRKGYALDAVLGMMEYGRKYLNITRFIAKISDENEASIKMFRDKLQFIERKKLSFFKETHFVYEYPTKRILYMNIQ